MVGAIIILIIIINIPSIIAAIIGFIWGLIEVASDSTEENYDEQSREECVYGTQEPLFFKGCLTEEDYKVRYRSLMKIYHPDEEKGNEEVAKQINQEFNLFFDRNRRILD